MSRKFAEFLEEQGIVWDKVAAADKRQLVLDLSSTKCEEPSMTVQADRAEVDINMIVARHKAAGIPLPPSNLTFGDGTELLTYEAALSAVVRAKELFARLPAATRLRFGNEPGEFMAFMADPAMVEESYSLGLRKRPKPEPPAVPPGDGPPPSP